MKVRDKKLKKNVDVSDKKCLKRECYWPRSDPGPFVQGRGYRPSDGTGKWLCGTRNIRGCPDCYCTISSYVDDVKTVTHYPKDDPRHTLPCKYCGDKADGKDGG